MTTEVLNTEQQEKLMKFFDKEIDPKHLAQIIRRYNHEISLMMIRDNQNNVINKQWIDDGFYWLNELAEIIDPNLKEN
jgi:hypothetical protein